MSSGNGSKYLTPCRTVGLRRVNRKTPVSSGSGAARSVNSPFTSPLIAGARTVSGIEKKCSSSLNPLWSSPLISKTCFKMGLSKPSGKQKTKDQSSGGLSTESSDDIYSTASGEPSKCLDGGSTPCTPIGVRQSVGGSKSTPSKCQPDWDTPETLRRTSPNVGAKPKSLLVTCAKDTFESLSKTPNTPLEKCHSVEITPISIVSKCSNDYVTSNIDTDGRMSTADVITPSLSHENSHASTVKSQPIKNGFHGWDLESEESVSLRSRLYLFKSFLKNQMVMKSTKAVTPSSPSSQKACRHPHSSSESKSATEDWDVSSESSNRNYLWQGDADNLDANSKNMDRTPESECKLSVESGIVHESEAAQDVSSKSASPTIVKDREERCASQSSMSFDSEEDETDEKWDVASSPQSECGTYTVKRNESGKLSLKRQPSLLISKRHKANRICGCATTFDLASSNRGDAKLEERSLGVGSSEEEFEKIKMDIQKWLEGGQRVIHEIIEEVRLQKDREMSVMEVLQEQGVDPDLVGYDSQQEEFITFDKFILKNGIS